MADLAWWIYVLPSGCVTHVRASSDRHARDRMRLFGLCDERAKWSDEAVLVAAFVGELSDVTMRVVAPKTRALMTVRAWKELALS